ncbi:serine hydrolase domain-containing protein [Parachitinimonas caeni]|uniref:Serine hydrolase n=1 Tax=Parachitinimonas caeni TaxID=3031301 RepID=A0ABT7E262_9NEIS|nr:serine hydrolase domain-containing protein [Parachitinimonas caeni]MDK2126406.1 serine hydrolase [Parachitinimonas caeni]
MMFPRLCNQEAVYLLAGAVALSLGGCQSDSAQATQRSVSCVARHPSASTGELQACAGDLSGKVDAALKPLLAQAGVTAATIAIFKGDTPLLEQAFGHRDAAATVPLPADALFMTASIIKPVTAAAIQRLARDGVLAMTDKVFCTEGNGRCWLALPASLPTHDPRLAEITIQHLLDHQGGWDATVSGDPLTEEAAIQQQLGLSTAPEQTDLMRAVLARPLDHAPGTRAAYSNFGYLLLGRIIEQAAKMPYIDYIRLAIFAPLGVPGRDIEAAKSRLKDRNPREPNYQTTVTAPSVFEPGKVVSALDGAVRAENWVAVGATITTASAMAKFAGRYRIPDGKPLEGSNNGGFSGADPGVATVLRQLPSGISYAVMMNKLDEDHPEGEASLQMKVIRQVDAAILAAGLN